MDKIFVVTGASSGIGKAAAERLRTQGHKVIGVARGNADIHADLGTRDGRQELIRKVKDAAPDGIDGIVTCAGSGDPTHPGEVTSLNYFGTTEIIEGLHPILRKPGGRCVAITSVGQLRSDENTAD